MDVHLRDTLKHSGREGSSTWQWKHNGLRHSSADHYYYEGSGTKPGYSADYATMLCPVPVLQGSSSDIYCTGLQIQASSAAEKQEENCVAVGGRVHVIWHGLLSQFNTPSPTSSNSKLATSQSYCISACLRFQNSRNMVAVMRGREGGKNGEIWKKKCPPSCLGRKLRHFEGMGKFAHPI